MTLSEDKILSKIDINLEIGTIEVLWKNRILRDGVVIDEKNHRGAYPLNEDREPDDYVVTDMGKTLNEILGESLAGSQRDLAIAMAQNAQLLEQNQVLIGKIQDQQAEINQLRG